MGKLIRNKAFLKFVILLFVLVPVFIFIVQTDFVVVKRELFQIGFNFIYIILTTFTAYVLGTWGWYFCLGNDRKKISISQLFTIRQIGETIALYNPTGVLGGDLLKVELLKSKHISKATVLNSVIVSRMTAMLSQILLFTLAMVWVLSVSRPQTDVDRWTLSLYAMLTILVLLKAYFFYWLASPLRHPTPDSTFPFKKNITHIRSLLQDVKIFFRQHPKMFWASYILFTAHWIVGSMEFYFILAFLELDVQIIQTLLVDMSIVMIKSLFSFVPGQIGVEELANKFMLSFIGISAGSIWITASVIRRSRQLFWIGVGSILYLCLKKRPQHATV